MISNVVIDVIRKSNDGIIEYIARYLEFRASLESTAERAVILDCAKVVRGLKEDKDFDPDKLIEEFKEQPSK